MMRLTIISGSPRTQSVTARVAYYLQQTIQQRFPEYQVTLIDTRDWNLGLLEKVWSKPEDASEAFRALAETMFNTDAFILVTPEYNGSYSPAMKNILDHFPKQSHKAFGIVTASTGAMGGMRAAMQLQQMVAAFFGILSPHMLIVPQVDKKFDADNTLLDEKFQWNIDNFLAEFIWLSSRVAAKELAAQG